jgi:MscS family membrane protein
MVGVSQYEDSSPVFQSVAAAGGAPTGDRTGGGPVAGYRTTFPTLPRQSNLRCMDTVLELAQEPWVQAAAGILISLLGAWLAEMIIAGLIGKLASKTKTDADDKIVEIIRRPIFLTVMIWGLGYSMSLLVESEPYHNVVVPLLETLTIFIWSIAGTRVGSVLLSTFAAMDRPRAMLQTRTLPVFDIFMRIMVVSGALYAMFLAWEIDLTAWLASAGVIGIAFGFAAKDTLANLFSGIFILADGPYKVKDWIVLDEKLRGEVTHIGIRSTRIMTNDEIEITIPNAVIGNAQLINETGGGSSRQRLRVPFSVAYGSDIAQVRQTVLECIKGADQVLETPTPRTRLRRLGDSGLEFELELWFDQPRVRDVIVDDVATRIYDALNAAKIEIPFPKQDVYIRAMPTSSPK